MRIRTFLGTNSDVWKKPLEYQKVLIPEIKERMSNVIDLFKEKRDY
jgi:hypothetical protein